MSFKHKLAVVIWTIVLLLVGNSVFFVYQLQTQTPLLKEEAEVVSRLAHNDIALLKLSKEIKFDTVQVQQWLTDISATRGLDGLNDGFDVAKEFSEKFFANIEAAKLIAQKADYSEIYQLLLQAEEAFPPYYETGQKMARSYVEKGPAGGNSVMSEFDAGAEKINEIVDELESLIDKKSNASIDDVETNIVKLTKNNESIIFIIYCLSGISVLIALIGTMYLLRVTSRNFFSLITDIKNTVDKKYDEDLGLDPDKKDEFGALAKHILSFREKLKNADKIASEQESMKEKAEEEKKLAMNELANKFEQEVHGMIQSVAAAATELSQTAESMGVSISDVDDKAKNASIFSKKTSENVANVAAASGQMSASVHEISTQVAKSTKVVNEAVEKADNAEASAKSLDEATAQIGNVIDLIKEIAEQTNLLALNATIEAARAGEAGKGFSVVASEVKNLASQTTKATEDIAKQIENVQSVSSEVAEALSAIKNSVDNVNQYSSGISAAVEEQSSTTNDIAKNMQTASQGSEEVNTSIAKINESASYAKDSAMQMLDASQMLSKEAEQLSSAVTLFLSEVRNG